MQDYGLNPFHIRATLALYCGARFEEHPAHQTICQIQGVNLIISDSGDLHLVDEIFRGLSYPIPFSEPCIVFDIGMNSAVAALDFARHPQVQCVYGFEPFPQTFQMAVENLKLNPELSKKIVPQCFGLSTIDETREINYSKYLRMSMTSRGIPPLPFSKDDISTETIVLKDIVDVFSRLFLKHSSSRYVLKMDCEGDEFELLPKLASSRLLDRFDLVMIEYHRNSPEELKNILGEAGFHVTGATRSEQIGFQQKGGNMIYAAKDPEFLA